MLEQNGAHLEKFLQMASVVHKQKRTVTCVYAFTIEI